MPHRSLALALILAVLGGCSRVEPPREVGDVEFSAKPGSGEPNLFATSDGRVILTWLEPAAEGHALRFAVRERGGWSEPRTVVAGRDFFVNWADFPSMVELDDGTWVVHWLEKVAADPYAYHVMLSLSHDRGVSWSEPFTPHVDRSPTEHGFVSMVPWASGAALVWLDGRKMASAGHDEFDRGEMSLRATTVGTDGTLGSDVLLDGRTCECCQTALVRAGDGLLAAYRDRSDEEIRNIAVVRFSGGAWSKPQHVADDGWYYPGCPVNGPQLAARGDTVVAVWFTAPENAAAVYAAYSFDAGVSFQPRFRIDDGDPLGRVDVELLPGGRAVAAWLERTETDAEIRARLIETPDQVGAGWTVSPTSESRRSGFPRMARVGDELVIAWTLVGESGGVRVATLEPD